MSESKELRRAPHTSSKAPFVAAVRQAEVRKLLAEHKAAERRRDTPTRPPRGGRFLSPGSTKCHSGLSPPPRLEPPPASKSRPPQSLDWMQSPPGASSCSLSETHASQHRTRQRDSGRTPVEEYFAEGTTWPLPAPRPSGASAADELMLIEGEIELYRTREAYEESVGRKLLSTYRKRLLRYEKDTLIAGLNVEYRRKQSERIGRRAG